MSCIGLPPICFRFFAIVSRFHLTIRVFFIHSSMLFIHSLSECFFNNQIKNICLSRDRYFLTIYLNRLELRSFCAFTRSDYIDYNANDKQHANNDKNGAKSSKRSRCRARRGRHAYSVLKSRRVAVFVGKSVSYGIITGLSKLIVRSKHIFSVVFGKSCTVSIVRLIAGCNFSAAGIGKRIVYGYVRSNFALFKSNCSVGEFVANLSAGNLFGIENELRSNYVANLNGVGLSLVVSANGNGVSSVVIEDKRKSSVEFEADSRSNFVFEQSFGAVFKNLLSSRSVSVGIGVLNGYVVLTELGISNNGLKLEISSLWAVFSSALLWKSPKTCSSTFRNGFLLHYPYTFY